MPERVSPVWVALSGVTWAAPSSGRVTENPYGIRRTTPSRRRTRKPYWSAPVAEDAALVTICSVVCPPGGTVTAPGTEIVTPGVDACGWTVTDHVPPPPPASLIATSCDRLAAPDVTARSPGAID